MSLLQEIQNHWKQDSVIDSNDIVGETARIGILHGKYLEYYNNAKLLQLTIQNQYNCLVRDKWRWYRGELTKDEIDELGWAYDPYKGCNKPLKAEIKEFYIDTDPDLVELYHRLELNGQAIDTAKQILEMVKWRHQNLKNIIEFRKFMSGN